MHTWFLLETHKTNFSAPWRRIDTSELNAVKVFTERWCSNRALLHVQYILVASFSLTNKHRVPILIQRIGMTDSVNSLLSTPSHMFPFALHRQLSSMALSFIPIAFFSGLLQVWICTGRVWFHHSSQVLYMTMPLKCQKLLREKDPASSRFFSLAKANVLQQGIRSKVHVISLTWDLLAIQNEPEVSVSALNKGKDIIHVFKGEKWNNLALDCMFPWCYGSMMDPCHTVVWQTFNLSIGSVISLYTHTGICDNRCVTEEHD